MKKILKANIVISIVIVVLIVGLTIFGISKFIDFGEQENNKQNNEITDNNENTNNDINEDYVFTTLNNEKYDSLSIPVNINTTTDTDINKMIVDTDSELVKQLYQLIVFDGTIETNLYSNNKVVVKDLTKSEILARALAEVKRCKNDSSNEYDIKFTPEDLKEKVIELYGDDVVENYKVNFNESVYTSWSYDSETNTYLAAGGASGCSSIVTDEYQPVVKVTKDDNNIYMYTEMYFGVSTFGNTSIYANYTDYQNNVLIGSEQSDTFPYTRFEGSLEYDNLFEYFKDKYPKIIHTYKHTFKKNANGGYYWYSTELLVK